MEVAIPHELTREEVRRRLRENSHRIGDSVPGGMADIETSWPSDDRMDMSISAMGQSMNGYVDIQDRQVVFNIDLPLALSFIKPVVEGAIQDQGRKLLAPPK